MDDVLRMNDAMIRFFFKENPDNLSDEDYASRLKELKWLSEEGLLRGIKL
ncbi:hypothetical protein [Proteiniphilum sp.]|nr:hypothetical protein [Proteiniphilum sp.]MEA4916545.1 hypothetical protein [Proteiniphilum sp.]MEA4948778.1 hypothetical protein [Petrimonas sp.]